MKTKLFAFFICSFILVASCKPSRESQIIGLWQEVGVSNPQMDEAMEQQRHFLDTVGLHTDSATNMASYGYANMDTLKKIIRTNMDSLKRAESKTIAETWFDFHPGGIVYLHSEEGLDSANWYFEDNALMLDEQKLKGGGAKLRMEVEQLNDTALQLHYIEKYLSSIARFRRVKR
jgi:hypothetical protein